MTDQAFTDQTDVDYVNDPARPMPTEPPVNAKPGHWEASTVYRPADPDDSSSELVLVDLRWDWVEDPSPTPEQIAYDYARGLQAEVIGLRDALKLPELRAAIAKIDPDAMREPAAGFDAFGVTVLGQAELNTTRENLADIGEALKATLDVFEGTTTALDKMIETSAAVLDAVPSPTVMAALVAAPSPVPSIDEQAQAVGQAAVDRFASDQVE